MAKTFPRIQSFGSLRDEMISVAQGVRKAPTHAAQPSAHSADLIARLLTPENRILMSVLRSHQPESVAQLAAITRRAPSNLTRTLEKLVSAGLVAMETIGRRKVPRAIADWITIDIDPFSLADVVRVHFAGRHSSENAQAVARKTARSPAAAMGVQHSPGTTSVAGAQSAKATRRRARAAT